MLIREALQRDLSHKIEEIVKVDQTDEAVVHEELSEYVATASITDNYRRVLSAMAEAPSSLSEGVGIWVSGFFGSGKSSFAKNLGYVLENRTLGGEPASDIFKRRVSDDRVSNLIDAIHSRFPVKVIMFDVQSDRAVGSENRSIAHYMYRVLLRQLDYAEDFDLAELEMTLESDGKLDEFCERVERRFEEPWSLRRKKAGKMNEASAILNEMDPETYSSADSWAKGRAGTQVEATPNLVVRQSYDLMERRFPGHALVYIIDEVGQFIARNSDRVEDVRRVVELLGKEGRNRVQAGKAVSPIWLVATSQERLDEVVSAIGDVRLQMAKVQDRFPIRVDLLPTDIREIVVKRVLAKKPEHVPAIEQLFENSEGALKTHAELERTRRVREFERDSFTEFHPYLPHHIDTLSIDIVSGIRLQPGADRTIGGATRTIIKQAYEMLVNDRTRLADEPIGTLVTLDKLYELLEPSLLTETRREVTDAEKKLSDDPWCAKVIKAVVLLGFVRDLPRTPKNIAALLYPRIDAPSPLPDVEDAIKTLVEAQHIRDSEDGYKVLTAHEKSWQLKKQNLVVKPRQRNELLDQMLEDAFSEPSFKTYSYEGRKFGVGCTLPGSSKGKGDIVVEIRRAESPDKLTEEVDAARVESRSIRHVFWVFPLTSDLDALVSELVRSREMVREFEQLRSQQKITAEESSTLDEEKRQVVAAEVRLRTRLGYALSSGVLLFEGKSQDVSSLAQNAAEALRKFLDGVVPELYPRLSQATVSPKPNDVSDILKAANFDALPSIYGSGGLGLFKKTGRDVTFDPDSPVAHGVIGYLKDRVDFGEKPTGRMIEETFGAPPYGWEPDTVRAALAGLYRGGALRITTKGKTYQDYTDEQSWPALTKLIDYRTATFAPQEQPDTKVLVRAREAYTALTGTDVDVDQLKISRALSDFVSEELAELPSAVADARVHKLPIAELLEAYQQELTAIEREDVQDRVTRLAQEGTALRKQRDEVARLRAAMSEENLQRFSLARAVVENVWPALERQGTSGEHREKRDKLDEVLSSRELFDHISEAVSLAESIQHAYGATLDEAHRRRNEAVHAAVDAVQGDERLVQLSEPDREAVLQPLVSRVCDGFMVELGSTVCGSCRASLQQLESDAAAASGLETAARLRVTELTTPEQKVQVVRAASFFGKIESTDDVERAVEALRDELEKYLSEGVVVIVE